MANSNYESLQVRFEKRISYGLSVEGNYTFLNFMDHSDVGGNAWIGNLGFAGAPQDLTILRAEKSVSANDVPNRLAFAAIYELPVGRGAQRPNIDGKACPDAAFTASWMAQRTISTSPTSPIPRTRRRATWDVISRIAQPRHHKRDLGISKRVAFTEIPVFVLPVLAMLIPRLWRV